MNSGLKPRGSCQRNSCGNLVFLVNLMRYRILLGFLGDAHILFSAWKTKQTIMDVSLEKYYSLTWSYQCL